MKKILTIVALALVLCLGISFALAASIDWKDLNEAQKEKIWNTLEKAGIWDSSRVVFDGDGNWHVGDLKGKIISCGENASDHTFGEVYYTYYDLDAGKVKEFDAKPAEEDLATLLHFAPLKENKKCEVCGFVSSKVIAAQLPHTMAPDVYYIDFAISGIWTVDELEAIAIEDFTKEDEKYFSCYWPKGSDLYKVQICEDCGAVTCTLVIENARGGHVWSNFKDVYEPATCQHTGLKARKCVYCGAWEPFETGDWELFDPIPTVAHDYSEKVYEYEWDWWNGRFHTSEPCCVNGLTAVYTFACKYCLQMYEGDVALPDFDNHGYTEQWTADQAAKELGWNEVCDTGRRIYPLYDEEGHHYILQVAPETGETTYACQEGYKWTYACEFCGKKLVISNGEEEPDYENGITTQIEYADCTHVKVTVACGICEGKVAGHTKTTELVLDPDDERAHFNGDWLVEQLEYRVNPTCITTGQEVYVCSECGYTLVVELHKTPSAHTYGEWTKVSDNVWQRKCIYCGYAIVETGATKPATNYWKFTKHVDALNCLEQSYDLYTWCDKNGKAILDGFGYATTTKVVGEFGPHLPVEVESFHKDATCSQKGQSLWICARCTNYNPEAPGTKLIDKMSYKGVGRGDPWFVLEETDMLPHTWDAGKVQEDGSVVYTCTVCKATKTEKGETKVEGFVVFDDEDNVLEGYVEILEGTVVPDALFARITFFFANGTYNVGSVQVAEDGSFEMQTGVDVIHYAVQIVNNNKVRPGEFTSYAGTEGDVK
jgi:hypothetical protein